MNFGLCHNVSRQIRFISLRRVQIDLRSSPLKCFCRVYVPLVAHKKKWQEYKHKRTKFEYERSNHFWQHFWSLFTTRGGITASSAFSIFSWFKWHKEEDITPETKLVEAIKRSVLCIQREQFDKAEQMLHLALRMAQDINSKEGIIYIYDVMANLAMEREQYTKAEKLFADVMRSLLADGHTETSPQILHISSKLAHMAQLQGDLEKAQLGFVWTLKGIQKNIEELDYDKDVQELFGLTKNWFGQLQLRQAKYEDAKKNFQEAFELLTDLYGPSNDKIIIILNNLSVTCVHLEDYTGAKNYIEHALTIAKDLNDIAQQGILEANLGLIYFHEGFLAKAKQICQNAYRIGKKCNNDDAVEQAEYCLNEIKATSASE
ncbi:tetratricopeptide repeat protein 19 homolog, mitochondrial [Teleopsis dalmanni]|uniref:tetratricopeptide repeat protein 19 homolog, mitochondrial n=1 Tax=Teleopsis dalmanni TaxID=139649 RepID=UPI0018CF18A8|nr:tetratricopeptide repeat protein 19 homolog, mitochondrial [Teleopsis dalmanni]